MSLESSRLEDHPFDSKLRKLLGSDMNSQQNYRPLIKRRLISFKGAADCRKHIPVDDNLDDEQSVAQY